ncbi:hypothetical protein [Geotalea toluenoxydans]|uniref:hypothetical protein n=1 Tax=Geotalea toluenoxydans TaxID=421624 RepID=UPI0006D23876|nr:hypothetical protein [Geotalea toluenoxydans]
MNGQTARSETEGRRQMAPPKAMTILGKVAKVGFYRDTLPLLIINIKKEDAGPLPYREGERVSIPFVVNGLPYIAGLRATTRSTTVMICSDLLDAQLNSVRLVDVLFGLGWSHREPALELTVRSGAVCCL